MTDKNCLNDFLDFTDHKKSKPHPKSSYAESTNQDASDNENILRSFKELRQKLKGSQKENNLLKEEAKINMIKLKQNQQALQLALTSNIDLKDQLEKQADVNKELKKRFTLMKEQIQKYNALEEQLEFTKDALMETRMKEKAMSNEQKKTMELFLQEKLEMGEELSKLRAKSVSDEKFMSHLEEQASRSKEQNIRLENHLRKLSISFEENSFNQKFNNENFEIHHLKDTISQLQKEVSTLKGKLNKEKQRRYLLEQQLIHLQESAGINNVKAVTYEGQTQLLTKKQDKMIKKIDDLTNKLQRLSIEKIAVEEQAIRYQMLSEEVIVKLKPLLTEDMIEILTYYENKLKNLAYVESQIAIQEDVQPEKPPSSIIQQNISRNNNERYPLQEHNYFNFYSHTPYKNYQNSNNIRSAGKQQTTPQTTRFTFGEEKQNELQQKVLEGKIRREREQMQKKLKQKWFQKKFDCSMPSQLHKLRADYINTFIDR